MKSNTFWIIVSFKQKLVLRLTVQSDWKFYDFFKKKKPHNKNHRLVYAKESLFNVKNNKIVTYQFSPC